MKRDFISTIDFTKKEITDIIYLSILMKKNIKAGFALNVLYHKILGILTEEDSIYTKCAFETAINELGGSCERINIDNLKFDNDNYLKDSAIVLSKYTDFLMTLINNHNLVKKIAINSTVPVINGISNWNDPIEEMADIITIFENLPTGKKIEDCKVVYVGPESRVCASLGMIITKMGGTFVQFSPKKYQLKKEYINICETNSKENSGTIIITDDESVALKDADFIYTDVWNIEDLSTEDKTKVFYPKYQVNKGMLKKCSKNVKFMHALSGIRGKEVTKDVIEEEKVSICYEQALNKLTAARGILVYLSGLCDITSKMCKKNLGLSKKTNKR